ncbi:hypothetical protein A9974_06390 [Achromobacter sp. UMC71]|nr:hypothetical protein [Achromobacter sp. UMC71]
MSGRGSEGHIFRADDRTRAMGEQGGPNSDGDASPIKLDLATRIRISADELTGDVAIGQGNDAPRQRSQAHTVLDVGRDGDSIAAHAIAAEHGDSRAVAGIRNRVTAIKYFIDLVGGRIQKDLGVVGGVDGSSHDGQQAEHDGG